MKKWVVLILFMTIMVFSSVCRAEESAPGTVALGVHGIGSEWSSGRPTVRWKASDKTSFDFTPVLSVGDFNGSNENSYTFGSNDAKQRVYGLNVGVVRQIRNIGGLSVGWRTEVGYVYNYIESSYQSTWPTISMVGSTVTYERRQSVDLGFGPDLEYFVTAVPGLSIGASAQIHYQYGSDHYHSVTTDSGGVFFSSGSGQDASRQSTLNLIGELLTLRYYY